MTTTLGPAQAKVRPWHREPWPWILLSLPLAAVVAGVVTLVIAMNNEDGLVAQDYYKRGLEINRVLEKERRAAALGIRAELALGEGRVSAVLSQPPPAPPVLTLRFVHPARAGEDRQATLALGSDGLYRSEVPMPADGRWRIQLEDAQRDWRLTGTWFSTDPVLRLAPDSAQREEK